MMTVLEICSIADYFAEGASILGIASGELRLPLKERGIPPRLMALMGTLHVA